MTDFALQVAGSKLAISIVLGAAVWLAARGNARPHLSHALSLALLTALLIPPLIALPVLNPAIAAPGPAETVPFRAVQSAGLSEAAAESGLTLRGGFGLVLAWILGAVAMIGSTIGRARVFNRSLRRASRGACPDLKRMAREIGRTLGPEGRRQAVRLTATPRRRPFLVVGSVLLGSACSEPPHVPPEGLPELFEAVEAEPALYESAMDGCVRIHNVWKAQVRAVHLTARGSIADRVEMLRDSVYAPYSEFWDGYLGDGFVRWVRREFDLAGHPHGAFPTRIDLARVIVDVTARAERMTGLRGCSEWYLVYGPGWAGMGGLTDGRMLVDSFGDHSSAEGMHGVVPHEVAHVLRDQGSAPGPWDVLAVIVMEGAADYFKDVHGGDGRNGAEALRYSESEWDWAIAHESELWSIAREQLEETDRAVIDLYQRSDLRLHPDGPTHVGYFLGYRIVEAYMARHGPDALVDLFRLPARTILERSAYDARWSQPGEGAGGEPPADR